MVKGSMEAFISGRILSIGFLAFIKRFCVPPCKTVFLPYLLGAFAAMSALVQIDDFMLSQHSEAAKEGVKTCLKRTYQY